MDANAMRILNIVLTYGENNETDMLRRPHARTKFPLRNSRGDRCEVKASDYTLLYK